MLTVGTDKPSYVTGEKITVTGKLTATIINQPLLLQVRNPQGKIQKIDQLSPAEDGSYIYKFRAGAQMNADGNNTVEVSYKGTTRQTTIFHFTSIGCEWCFMLEVGKSHVLICSSLAKELHEGYLSLWDSAKLL